MILKCLLLQSDNNDSDISDSVIKDSSFLSLCKECVALFLKISKLYTTLETLAGEFNGLRKEIGKLIIIESLGHSDKEWTAWEDEVLGVEKFYPFVDAPNKEVKDKATETESVEEPSVVMIGRKSKPTAKLKGGGPAPKKKKRGDKVHKDPRQNDPKLSSVRSNVLSGFKNIRNI